MQLESELKELVFGEFAHGANIYAVSKLYSLPNKTLVDLSSSTNPLVSEWLKQRKKLVEELLENVYQYPDPEATELKKAISKKLGVCEENILPSSGSVELMYFVLWSLRPKRVVIFEPSFVEYLRACNTVEAEVERVFILNQDSQIDAIKTVLKKRKADLVFLCNPNNPTGSYLKKEEVLSVVKEFEEVFFVIDEAFVEFIEEESVVKEAVFRKNLLVLRSLTKFYGLAGLRIGFGIGEKGVIKRIKQIMPPWRINTLAEKIAKVLILDEEFYQRTKSYFLKEKNRFEEALKRLKVKFFPSVTNFYLLYFKNRGKKLWEDFLKRGILLRSCFNFFGLGWDYIRVSLKQTEENERFLKELEKWLKAV